MENRFVVTTSPFVRDNITTKKIMLEVCIALVPTVIASVVLFGLRALLITLLSILSCVLFEYLFQKFTKQNIMINDLSAVVTGLLLAMNIPVSAPLWIPVFGALLAIILVKQLFGGIGQNFINPALAARVIMFISWVSLMSARLAPEIGNLFLGFTNNVDLVTLATPLTINNTAHYSVSQLFFGNIPGMIGETCKLSLLIGGIYLIYKKIIDWRVPIFFVGTVFILYFIKTGIVYSIESGIENPVSQILSGGLILGALFMATDYVTCPIHKTGRAIMGVGCGLILFIIRSFGNYPEGCSFAILFMNVATPLIDKWTRPKTFGEGRV